MTGKNECSQRRDESAAPFFGRKDAPPSPRSNETATSGTGSHDGRPVAAPSSEHSSAMRTGCGAVTLYAPERDSSSMARTNARTVSSRDTQLSHCLPSPGGPPTKSWKRGTMRASAPPPRSNTTPSRSVTRRRPSDDTALAAASPAKVKQRRRVKRWTRRSESESCTRTFAAHFR